MVMNCGLLRDTEEADMRNVKNQNEDMLRGHAKAFWGSFKGCGGFFSILCAVPKHTQALTGIQRNQNLSYKLRKTLTQISREKSSNHPEPKKNKT